MRPVNDDLVNLVRAFSISFGWTGLDTQGDCGGPKGLSNLVIKRVFITFFAPMFWVIGNVVQWVNARKHRGSRGSHSPLRLLGGTSPLDSKVRHPPRENCNRKAHKNGSYTTPFRVLAKTPLRPQNADRLLLGSVTLPSGSDRSYVCISHLSHFNVDS